MLHFILVLLNLKVKHSWSDGSFNNLLLILAWLLPKANKVPVNTCQAKKLGSPFTIGVERTIHACPNNYILYRGGIFNDFHKCHVCPASQYKNNASYCGGDNQGPTGGNKRKRKGTARNSVAYVVLANTTLGISEKKSRISAMVIWYLPISDHQRCFFSNPKHAELM